jgi:asparagine synthase (glutamine-hydrolysing)
MMSRIVHRGPDDSGTYRHPQAALGFRRLSIVDLEGGHQPLSNEDGTIWTVFNGEIYNFPELRQRLQARGHVLRSAGDTEVLVHLYEDEGVGMFKHLRGMFALAIWDAARRTLILARDRMGQKPLIYRHDGERLTFASELKALLALPEADIPRRIDPIAVDLYLTYGYVPHPRTILEGIHKLPPAHYAVWRDGELTIDRYWQPEWDREEIRDPREEIELLRETLTDAVREQMVADVPLGAFLSGGIDSTIIVGLMRKVSATPVKTFAIGFDDPAYDETAYASLAARHLGTEHETFIVEPHAWETLPALARQFDEPFADSSALPTWRVAEETRRAVTVALTGDAGDELFGGYDRYRALGLTELFHRIPTRPRRWIGSAALRFVPKSAKSRSRLRRLERLIERINEPAESRYAGWMTTFDDEQRRRLYSTSFLDRLATAAADSTDPSDADPRHWLRHRMALAGGRDPITRAMVADLTTYLPGDLLVKVDLSSMAHSLECRGPFLDHRVVELAASIPARRKLDVRRGRSKIVLKEAFAEFLPTAIRSRPKMGFGVPISRWFREDLKDELREVLLDPICAGRGLFRSEEVRSLLDEHATGRREHAPRLWALVMLEFWFRTHLDRPAASSEF